MFGRTIQVAFVRNKKRADGTERPTIDLENLDYDKLGEIVKDTVKIAALSIVGIGAAFFVLGTVQKVIVNVANPANYR